MVSVTESTFTRFILFTRSLLGVTIMVLTHFFLGISSKWADAIWVTSDSNYVIFFLYLFGKKEER